MTSRRTDMHGGNLLFRQGDLAFNSEVSGDARCSGIRLAATDADGVITAGDNRISIFRHHAQVPVLQLKMDLLACAGIEVNALESTQSYSRRPIHWRKFQIKLH